MRKPLRDSIIFPAILFIALSAFSFISARNDRPVLYAKLLWSLVVACAGFGIYRSGAISRYRSILFSLIALFFLLGFKFFRSGALTNTLPPYCHIAQASTLFHFIGSQFLALTSGQWLVWGVLTLGFLWLLILLTIGQGICSWVCFYGGVDDACSRIAKRPLVKLRIPKPWRDFPIAFLIFILIVSFLQGLPVYCIWFCPFKMTEAFWNNESSIRLIQTILFWSILIGSTLLLPLLTKKRTFCSLLCPFGALASLCGKAAPYKVVIHQDRCIHCGKCEEICPVFAVEEKGSKEYIVSDFCTRCGTCIDGCPVDAISLESKSSGRRIDTKELFIFLALLVTGVLSGSFVPFVFLKLLGL